MKDINYVFSRYVRKALECVFVSTDYGGCISIFPIETKLTSENFGILIKQKFITIDDIQWYKKDGSNRNFYCPEADYIFESTEMPDEVVSFINEVLGIKFAEQKLNEAKNLLADDVSEAHLIICDAIEAFTKASKSQEKFDIAAESLYKLSKLLQNEKEFFNKFMNAYNVISDVIQDINF